MHCRLNPYEIDTVILCGGRGTRLQGVVDDRPKPLAEVCGRPFLDTLIQYAADYGFRRFLLLAGYKGEMIREYAAAKSRDSSLEIECLVETTALGTGGAVKNAGEFIKSSRFLVLNGDSICPGNLINFQMYHVHKNALVTMMLSQAMRSGDYGQVVIDAGGRVEGFLEKPAGGGRALVNAGVYLMEKSALEYFPPGLPCSLERDIFPSLIGRGFYGYVVRESHLDIGTPDRYFSAGDILPGLVKRDIKG
ncbi:MAG: sugar phosphate nucleotidyltransferase [Desulfocucumaceae bacterium]